MWTQINYWRKLLALNPNTPEARVVKKNRKLNFREERGYNAVDHKRALMHGVNKESRYSFEAGTQPMMIFLWIVIPFVKMLCSLPKTLQAEHCYYPFLK
jgi:hypothetical protein